MNRHHRDSLGKIPLAVRRIELHRNRLGLLIQEGWLRSGTDDQALGRRRPAGLHLGRHRTLDRFPIRSLIVFGLGQL